MPVASIAQPAGGPLARIAQIRARFEPAATSATTATTGSGFSQVLDAALAAGGSTDATAATTASSGAAGDRVAQLAQEYLGIPYRWGGTDPATGLDCSGFLQHLFRRVGVDLPRTSAQQATAGRPVASLEEARPGDLVAFGEPVDHVGVYIGDGKMVHAPHTGDVVKVSDIGSRRITAIRRVLPEPAGAAGALLSAGSTAAAAGLRPPYVVGAPGGGDGGTVLPAAIVDKVRRFEPLFVAAGAKYGIDPAILAAQCQRESGGNTDAVSGAGAQGLMQFMPSTARARGVDPWDPASAIDGAASYLAEMRGLFGGSMELAIAAYAAGPGAVRRAGDAMPNQQTRDYVTKLLALAGGPR